MATKQQQLAGTTPALFKTRDVRPLWKRLEEAGIMTEGRYSDLYFPATAKAMEIFAEFRSGLDYPLQFERFISQIDGKLWIDVPLIGRKEITI